MSAAVSAMSAMSAGFSVQFSAVVAIDDTKVSPGVLGFVVVALLGLATYLLIRSMNRQIKRIDLPTDDHVDDDADDGAERPRDDDSDLRGDQPQR